MASKRISDKKRGAVTRIPLRKKRDNASTIGINYYSKQDEIVEIIAKKKNELRTCENKILEYHAKKEKYEIKARGLVEEINSLERINNQYGNRALYAGLRYTLSFPQDMKGRKGIVEKYPLKYRRNINHYYGDAPTNGDYIVYRKAVKKNRK